MTELDVDVSFTITTTQTNIHEYKVNMKMAIHICRQFVRIKDADGNTVIEGYTDENGIAKFTLRYGKYTYSEFKSLDGYYANDKEYPFEIKEDGQIIKAEMTNEKIPVPDSPQTGDNSNLGFWIGLAAVALGGLVATVIIGFKRKKEDEDE